MANEKELLILLAETGTPEILRKVINCMQLSVVTPNGTGPLLMAPNGNLMTKLPHDPGTRDLDVAKILGFLYAPEDTSDPVDHEKTAEFDELMNTVDPPVSVDLPESIREFQDSPESQEFKEFQKGGRISEDTPKPIDPVDPSDQV